MAIAKNKMDILRRNKIRHYEEYQVEQNLPDIEVVQQHFEIGFLIPNLTCLCCQHSYVPSTIFALAGS